RGEPQPSPRDVLAHAGRQSAFEPFPKSDHSFNDGTGRVPARTVMWCITGPNYFAWTWTVSFSKGGCDTAPLPGSTINSQLHVQDNGRSPRCLHQSARRAMKANKNNRPTLVTLIWPYKLLPSLTE